MSNLTPLQSRYLALGLFVLAVSVVVAALSWPWYSAYAGQVADLEHKERQISVDALMKIVQLKVLKCLFYLKKALVLIFF